MTQGLLGLNPGDKNLIHATISKKKNLPDIGSCDPLVTKSISRIYIW